MPIQVFVSYSQHDGADLRTLVAGRLEEAGFSTWVDDDRMIGGQQISEGLSIGIQSSHACVIVVTPRWLDSPYCLAEAAAFHFGGRPLIPYLQNVDLRDDLPPFLSPKLAKSRVEDAVKSVSSLFGVKQLVIVYPRQSPSTAPRPSSPRVVAEALQARLKETFPELGAEIPLAHPDELLHRPGTGPLIALLPSEAVNVPDYVSARALRELRGWLGHDKGLELGLGVETRDVHLRNKILQKGLSDRAIGEVMKACAEAGVRFVAYLLVKPHTLTEREAIRDALDSAAWVFALGSEIGVDVRVAFEPVFITKGTKLEREYLAGRYKLLNLWSLVHMARTAAERGWPVFIGMSDEGLSDRRTPRACDACSDRIVDAIERFNANGRADCFDGLHCECRLSWSVEALDPGDRDRAGAV